MKKNEIVRMRECFQTGLLDEFMQMDENKKVFLCLKLLYYDLKYFDERQNYTYFFSYFTYLSQAIHLSLQEQKQVYAHLQIIRTMILQISLDKPDKESKFFSQILGKIEILSWELSSHFDESYDKSKRELLYQIIFEIRNISVVTSLLKKLPHQMNVLDKHGYQLFIDILNKYIEALQNYVSKEEDFADLHYYDRLIAFFFLQNQKYMTLSIAKKMDTFLEMAQDYSISSFSRREFYFYSIQKWRQVLLEFQKNPKHGIVLEALSEEKLMYQFHVSKNFSEGMEVEAKYLFTKYGDLPRSSDMTQIYTVDDVSTLDRDDGFSCSKDGNKYHLGIHIICPVKYFHEKSILLEEATHRTATLYDEHKPFSSMFPKILSEKLFCLEENTVRYSFSSYYDIDLNTKKIWKKEFVIEPVYVRKNDTYEHCNEILNFGSKDIEYQTTLENIQDLLPFLKSFFTIDETYAEVNFLTHPKILSTAQDMIETLMIFQNNQIARHAMEMDIPILYRNHFMNPVYKQNLKELQSVIQKEKENRIYLHEIQVVLDQYPRSFYSITNEGHYGLNLSCYTHFTSPDRRVCDDYNMLMYQKFFFLEGEAKEKEFWKQKLSSIAAYLNTRNDAIRMFLKEYRSLKKQK